MRFWCVSVHMCIYMHKYMCALVPVEARVETGYFPQSFSLPSEIGLEFIDLATITAQWESNGPLPSHTQKWAHICESL